MARIDVRPPPPGAPRTLIAPPAGWVGVGLGDIWRARELLYFFAWRDLKVRYKQTVVGAAWVIIQPLMIMAVFTVFFGRLVGVGSDGIPYPVFVYAGLLPWNYFNLAMNESSGSLVAYSNLVTKVYFPRLIVPLAPVVSSLVDLAISGVIFFALMAVYGILPSWQVVFLPVFLVLLVADALLAGVWLSALNLQYRDVRHLIPFATQVLFFVTPVIYPSSLLQQPWKTLYALNPLAAVVDGIRWSVLGSHPPELLATLLSATASLTLLVLGALYFRRAERSFADVA